GVQTCALPISKSAGDLFSTPGFVLANFDLFTNLQDLSTYDGGIFWRWGLNSIIYSVIGAAMTTFVCAITGYGLAVYRFRGRATVIAVVLASMLIPGTVIAQRSEEHTSELQSRFDLVCRLLLEKKKKKKTRLTKG